MLETKKKQKQNEKCLPLLEQPQASRKKSITWNMIMVVLYFGKCKGSCTMPVINHQPAKTQVAIGTPTHCLSSPHYITSISCRTASCVIRMKIKIFTFTRIVPVSVDSERCWASWGWLTYRWVSAIQIQIPEWRFSFVVFCLYSPYSLYLFSSR